MKQKVFLVHGWSVISTETYQALHKKLAQNGFTLHEIHLGRYVSLEDNIEIRDIAKAMHNALIKKMDRNWKTNFHIITHSTGALVTKHWIVNYYKNSYLQHKPLKNVIFLAGPHFGSRLAHHGKSMLAQIRYLGATGKKILNALELGSSHSWEIADQWLNADNWKKKGIMPYNLIGDRVEKDIFMSKIFPANFEKGSDMVVRVASGNLNFTRFRMSPESKKLKKVGSIEKIPFGVMAEYTHSKIKYGIMNSITKNSTPDSHQSLRLILSCLKVNSQTKYEDMRKKLEAVTKKTRKKQSAFAQLDFKFVDEEKQPINDYLFKLGAIKNGVKRPSKTIAHTHKNRVHPNHFTVFIDLKNLEPELDYFIEFNSDSGSELFRYEPDPMVKTFSKHTISDIIKEDQTTQIEVVLPRKPHNNLFVFHNGDDPDLHVKWDRQGKITKNKIAIK